MTQTLERGRLDAEHCYRAVASRDPRFDGWFVTAVHSTGIYCRPSCPARTPLQRNVSFHTTAASAQSAGFRACRRCRPDAVPGSPEWDVRADVVARAMRLIADGEVERAGVGGLASRLGYSERQLHRLLTAELGVGPLALARAQRAQTARLLIETTRLPMADVAFAAGFASIRQFNETVQSVFATTPSALRPATPRSDGGTPGWLTLRLAARAPFAADEVLLFLGAHATPGLEEWDGTTFSRVLDLPHGPAVVRLSPSPDGGAAVTARLRLTELRDLGVAVTRCRRLLDLDADPAAVDAVLGADPALAALVAGAPGRRVPTAPDADELAVRAVRSE
ncbi:bifunctional transcriptional activator/DNA repair enzyme AdaA, partial [Modestobacter versicolor]